MRKNRVLGIAGELQAGRLEFGNISVGGNRVSDLACQLFNFSVVRLSSSGSALSAENTSGLTRRSGRLSSTVGAGSVRRFSFCHVPNVEEVRVGGGGDFAAGFSRSAV